MSRLIREEDVTKHVMHAGDVAKQDPDLQVVGLGHVYSAPTVEMHLTTCGDCKYGELDIQEHGYLEPPTCVDEQPTVDAVEVVRCKDCVWNKQPQCPLSYTSPISEDGEVSVWYKNKGNDYCSYGKRKGGAE